MKFAIWCRTHRAEVITPDTIVMPRVISVPKMGNDTFFEFDDADLYCNFSGTGEGEHEFEVRTMKNCEHNKPFKGHHCGEITCENYYGRTFT